MEIGKEYIVSAKFPNGYFFRINANTNFDAKSVVYLGQDNEGVKPHKFWLIDTDKVVKVNPRVTIEYVEYDSGFARPQELKQLLNAAAAGDPTTLQGGAKKRKGKGKGKKTRKHSRKHKGKKHTRKSK